MNEGISPAEYLVRHALVSMESLYSAFAELCGVPFLPERGFRFRTLNDRPLTMGEQDCGPTLLSLYRDKTLYAIAPEITQFRDVYIHLTKYPEFAKQIRIASPDGLHHASSVSNSPAGDLESRFPFFSASKIRAPASLVLLLLLLGLLPLVMSFGPVFMIMITLVAGSALCAASGS